MISKIDSAVKNYCNILGIDVKSLDKSAHESLEDFVIKYREQQVLLRHKYKLPSKESYKRGRQKTRVPDSTAKDNRRTLWANSHQEMIDKLYDFYMGNTMKLETVFYEMCDYCLKVGKPRPKTIEEYKNIYKYFFKDEPLAEMNLGDITVEDMSEFFIRAHHKVSKLDISRGMDCIEKHKHDDLITIVNRIYKYAKIPNPLTSLSFDTSEYPFYRLEHLEEPEGYSQEDIKKLIDVFDNLKEPTIPQLVVGVILETYARLGEVRALRFKDFHFEGEEPYLRICGLANGSRREERVKKDAVSGKRNLGMTPRLERIYELGKEISWSDEFIFVKDKEYVTDEDIETNNVCVTDDAVRRALKSLCKKAKINYHSPHQIRFYGAMEMVNETGDIYSVAHFLGHSNIKTTQHYSDKLNSKRVYKREKILVS